MAFGLNRILESLLENRYPDLKFEVINAAMTAINSHVVLPIARECASRNEDLWIVYMGNNEVVGPYGPGSVFGASVPGLSFIRTSLALRATRSGQVIESSMDRIAPNLTATNEWNKLYETGIAQQMPRAIRTSGYFVRASRCNRRSLRGSSFSDGTISPLSQ